MAQGLQILLVISLVATFIAFLLNIIAFATPAWLVSNGNSPFKEVGFFVACFDQCTFPFCPVTDEEFHLDGCYRLWEQFQHDYYIEQMWHWLTPGWFTTCRILVIILIPVLFIVVMLLATAALIAFKHEELDKEHDEKSYWLFILMISGGIVLLAYSGVSAVACVAVFYTGAFRLDWMPYTDKNHLGYSYWMEVVVAVLTLVAFFLTVWALIMKCLRDKSSYVYSSQLDTSEFPEGSQSHRLTPRIDL